jgi:cytochrome P450
MQAQQEVPYDPFNPYPWYRYMRETCPVYHSEQVKMWYVFRYEDVQQVLTDIKTFSSAGIQGDTYLEASFLRMDPPRHRRYRTLVSQAFTLRSVALLEPRIAVIVNDLLDAVAHAGQMDVITDLAYPLPATVIMELFGVPVADREYFKQLSELFIEETENPATTEFVSQEKLAAYLLPLIDERRAKPTGDLISRLLAAEVEGEKLSTHDIQASCILMLVAGHETTTNLIGNAMFCFTKYPDVMAELLAHPELLPDALEEVLRYRPAVCGTFRITTADAQIGATTIKARQPLIAQISSANHDETAFADPERFDIRRTPNRHLGFGQGVHFCLGAPLARLESKIAFSVLLRRFSDLKRLPGTPVQLAMGPAGLFQGTKHFPITFTPQDGAHMAAL